MDWVLAPMVVQGVRFGRVTEIESLPTWMDCPAHADAQKNAPNARTACLSTIQI